MNFFVLMCITAIQTGRMTIEQVPERYQKQVREVITPGE